MIRQTDIIRSPELEPIGFRANEQVKQYISALVLQAELKRKGDGPTVIAGALGGAVEAAWELLQMAPDQFRAFLMENMQAYCDHIDPPEEDEDDE